MTALIVPVFIAGIVMFLAPCTLPIVPGYLAFISGVHAGGSEELSLQNKKKIRRSALFFVLGFSLVFILLGLLLGLFGSLIAPFKNTLSQIGGGFIILFGLMMLGLLRFSFFEKTVRVRIPKSIQVGTPASSFLVGAIFSLGWSPCVGPVLATVFILASTTATALSGAILLAVFSLGLAIPFLLTARWYSNISNIISKYQKAFSIFVSIGAVIFIVLGIFLVLDKFYVVTEFGFKVLDFLNYQAIENYL